MRNAPGSKPVTNTSAVSHTRKDRRPLLVTVKQVYYGENVLVIRADIKISISKVNKENGTCLTRHATNSYVLHVTAGMGKCTVFHLKYIHKGQLVTVKKVQCGENVFGMC